MDITENLHFDPNDRVVSTLYLKLLIRLIEQHFPDSCDNKSGACTTPQLALEKDSRISFRTLATEYLTRLKPQNAGIGFRYGEKLSLIAADALGQLVMSSATCEEAIAHLKHFRLLLGIPFDFELEIPLSVAKASVSVNFHALYCTHYPAPLNWFISEALFSVLQQQARWLTGQNISFLKIHFPYPKPAHYEQYEKHFGCPCIFDAAKHAAEFDVAILSLPIVTVNEDLKTHKLAVCEHTLRTIERRFNPVQRLHALFKRRFPTLPCIDEAAEELGMSKSALHRKLQDEKTSYQCLVNEFKRKKSEYFLKYTNRTISEIAEQIGFSDSSTFRRAFKTWTGLQPSQLRTDEKHTDVLETN
jgi:AraC-like DNA-binding protein